MYHGDGEFDTQKLNVLNSNFIMKLFYILLICFLLFQCSVDKTSSEELTLKDSICYIDTTLINSKLKHIIKSYIQNYPQFNNLVLMHDNFVVKSKYKDLNVDELYVLGPTFSGESYEESTYPAFFFTISDKNVFIKSYYDRFMNQKLCESVYMNYLEIRMLSSSDEKNYWLIRIDKAGNVSVLTYNTEEYLGYDEVKEPSTFTAPALR